MQSTAANCQGRPCCVTRPLASTCAMPSIEATERSKLFEASGIITASATKALIDRLFTIDRKVKAVRNVSALRSAEHHDQHDQQDCQVPDGEEARRAARMSRCVVVAASCEPRCDLAFVRPRASAVSRADESSLRVQLRRDAAAIENERAVADAGDLLEIGRDQQDRQARSRDASRS